MAKVLIVEDDNDLSCELAALLKQNRHVVDVVGTVRNAEDYLFSSPYDVIILDWNLPDGDGLSLLQEIRDRGLGSAVLMLTARNQIKDKVDGFSAGGDDYLTKPFAPEELISRINALLRRPREYRGQVLRAGDIELDSGKRLVKQNNEVIHLTPKEFAVLEFFLEHQDQVFTQEALLERIWQADNEATSRTVVATILRLRKKIDHPDRPSLIRNVFGSGYMCHHQD